MAPMTLNCVARDRRTLSQNVLSEKRSSSVNGTPRDSDPSVEYAWALRWKRGRQVSMWSSAPSPSQAGKPSPVMT